MNFAMSLKKPNYDLDQLFCSSGDFRYDLKIKFRNNTTSRLIGKFPLRVEKCGVPFQKPLLKDMTKVKSKVATGQSRENPESLECITIFSISLVRKWNRSFYHR